MRDLTPGENALTGNGEVVRILYCADDRYQTDFGDSYSRHELVAAGDQVVDGDDEYGTVVTVSPLRIDYRSGDSFEWLDPHLAGLQHATLANTLSDWWDETSAQDRDDCVAKTAEYGAGDLGVIGEMLASFGVTAATGREAEMGCWFYLCGKVARANSAYDRGEAPSDDTIKDIETYSRMIRRIRQNGEWG